MTTWSLLMKSLCVSQLWYWPFSSAQLDVFFSHAAVVSKVLVQQLSPTSVRVTWQAIDVPELTGYTVYYSSVSGRKRQADEVAVEVPSTQSSIDITDLTSGVQYQFQVVAMAVLDGVTFVGMRSLVHDQSMLVITTPTVPAFSSTVPTFSSTEMRLGLQLLPFSCITVGLSLQESVHVPKTCPLPLQ